MNSPTGRRSRILLAGACFSVPLGVLLHLTSTNINSGIAFASKEIAGVAFLGPVFELMWNVADYGMQNPGPECAMAARRAEDMLDRLEEASRRHGALLAVTPEGLARRGRSHLAIRAIRRDWERIRASGCPAPEGRSAALMENLRSLIGHVGDTSNLVLDPELDTYYLMDAVVNALPRAQVLQHSVLLGSGTPDRMRVQAAILHESGLVRIRYCLETAINEDSNYSGSSATLRAAVIPALQRYEESVGRFGASTVRSSAHGSPPDLRRAGAEAFQAALDLGRASARELDALLKMRMSAMERRRSRELCAAGLAIAAAYGMFWLLLRSPPRRETIGAG